MAQYLDKNGLNYLWQKIKEKLDKKAPAYTYGTEDLIAGESNLEQGVLYFVVEEE